VSLSHLRDCDLVNERQSFRSSQLNCEISFPAIALCHFISHQFRSVFEITIEIVDHPKTSDEEWIIGHSSHITHHRSQTSHEMNHPSLIIFLITGFMWDMKCDFESDLYVCIAFEILVLLTTVREHITSGNSVLCQQWFLRLCHASGGWRMEDGTVEIPAVNSAGLTELRTWVWFHGYCTSGIGFSVLRGKGGHRRG
jgi:hypothetical protein